MSQIEIETDELSKDVLYKWDGMAFIAIEKDDSVVKLPITLEADKAIKAVRNSVSKSLGFRPELSLVASALLIKGAERDDLVDIVRNYGTRLYKA